MGFSYQFGANPTIDVPRLLIMDTVDAGHVFEDEEIMMAYKVEAGLFLSPQFFSGALYAGAQGMNPQSQPVSWRRVAATLMDALASNYARLANALKVLDIQVNTALAAQELRAQAQQLRTTEDDSGSIAIVEQCINQYTFRDRYWNTVQRQVAGG